jgi:hypothetical protein
MNWHGREVPATHNVIAIFGDLPQARHAIEVLERAGIDAGDIALLGDTAEEADRRAEHHLPKGPFLSIGRGMLLGAVGGACISALVAWIATALFYNGRIVIGVITGAIVGLVGGSLFGAMAGISLGDAWEMSYEPVHGRVAVNVGSDDVKTIERAHERLERQAPITVVDFDDADLDNGTAGSWIRAVITATRRPDRRPLAN